MPRRSRIDAPKAVDHIIVRGIERDEFNRKYALTEKGYDFDAFIDWVLELLGIDRTEVLLPGRQPHRVKARSMVCYLASWKLWMNVVELAKLSKYRNQQ